MRFEPERVPAPRREAARVLETAVLFCVREVAARAERLGRADRELNDITAPVRARVVLEVARVAFVADFAAIPERTVETVDLRARL